MKQTNLIDWMEDCQRVLYIPRAWNLFKKRKSVSKEAWNESSLLQVQHKSLKAAFESEPEEEHDDQQVAFQVQSQQRCYSVSCNCLRESWWMQARNAVIGKIHEVLVDFINQSLGRDVRDTEGEF